MAKARKASSGYWIYGLHAVAAALRNPARDIQRIVLSKASSLTLADALASEEVRELNPRPQPRIASREAIEALLPPDSVHQGAAAEVKPLPSVHLLDVLAAADGVEGAMLIVLDQVTDPHNVGAIVRSAAAFGCLGLIVQDRHTPAETGALAKAASGALDNMPIARVGNLAAALKTIADAGFWRIGLTGHAEQPLKDVPAFDRAALVLGAEGTGLRRLTAENCDYLACIPLAPDSESLNVSNAAAIGLYELTQNRSRNPG